MFGSKKCPHCKNKSKAPWRTMVWGMDGKLVASAELDYGIRKGTSVIQTSNATPNPAFDFNHFFIIDDNGDVVNHKKYPTTQQRDANSYTWFANNNFDTGCPACDGEHSAAAAMRRKMEGLW